MLYQLSYTPQKSQIGRRIDAEKKRERGNPPSLCQLYQAASLLWFDGLVLLLSFPLSLGLDIP